MIAAADDAVAVLQQLMDVFPHIPRYGTNRLRQFAASGDLWTALRMTTQLWKTSSTPAGSETASRFLSTSAAGRSHRRHPEGSQSSAEARSACRSGSPGRRTPRAVAGSG